MSCGKYMNSKVNASLCCRPLGHREGLCYPSDDSGAAGDGAALRLWRMRHANTTQFP